MRHLFAVVMGALMVVSLAGCSEEQEPLAVELVHTQEHGLIPFTATGSAADEAAICSRGTTEIDHLESVDGEAITDEDWADMFDTAMAEGGIAEMNVLQEYICEDGSGNFTMRFLNRFDFATFEFEGQQNVGSWEIEEGTGEYVDLSGSGDAALDWDNEKVTYNGEIKTS